MSQNEFDIIKSYFSLPPQRDDVLLAGGDDCAIVNVPADKELVITTDTLNSGVHFPENTSPEDIAFKALMVNLSDLAAMGATPAWISLAISLPRVDESWLAAFSRQLGELLQQYNISLIGGDTTRGQLSITIQAMGLCDRGRALRRDGARAGDKVFITGYPGMAAIGLRAILDGLEDEKLRPCIDRLNRPQARLDFAQQLPAFSRCAIDISDGLIADLGHILEASDCGALIHLDNVPLADPVQYYFRQYHQGKTDWSLLLTQGDDYELCFTCRPEDESQVQALAAEQQLPLSCIGEINTSAELVCLDGGGNKVDFSEGGFQHFSNADSNRLSS